MKMSITASTFSDLSCYRDYFFQRNDKIKLVGRKTELAQLIDAFEKVKSTSSFESIAIHGLSGTGKTTLARKLQEFVCEEEGFFCTGKCFQNSGEDPFSALMAAFSDLCDLTLQSSDFDKERLFKIQKALGSHGNLLENNITNISPFLESESRPKMHEVKNENAFATFKVACKAFLRAMTSNKEHTVTIFLDDVQWIDKDSMSLIQELIQDTDVKNLLLIFAYRDEEADTIGDILPCSTECNIIDVPLKNLDLEDLQEMVSGILEFPPADDICDLSKLILHKTQGNPFHILQFIESIKENGMLTRDAESWSYDLGLINRQTNLSEPLARLLSLKVRRLDLETQEMLKVASLIGYRFTAKLVLETTMKLLKSKNEKVNVSITRLRDLLRNATNDAFIDEIQDEYYQFSHDKIQHAFCSLISEVELPMLHLMIGNELKSKTDEFSTYQAAIHLNRSPLNIDALTSEYVDLARINLQAAKYCQRKYAFTDTVSLLRSGLSLLDKVDKWSNYFELTFEMTELLAQMELAIGDFKSCKVTNKELLHRAISNNMKIPTIRNEVELGFAANKPIVSFAEKALRQLGVDVPKIITPFHLLSKLKKVRLLISKCKDEDILSRQVRTDPDMSTVMWILVHITADCFMRKKIKMAVYAALLATELTMTIGIFPDSCIAIITFGIVEAMQGRVEEGYRMGNLALNMLINNPDNDKSIKAQVICQATAFLIWRKRRLKDLIRLQTEILTNALDTCNWVAANACAIWYLNARLWTGDNLESCEKHLRHIYHRMSELGQDVLYLQPMLQLILNLRYRYEDWSDHIVLTGESMDEEHYAKDATDFMMVLLQSYKLFLSYTFGYYQAAQAAGSQLFRNKLAQNSFLFIPINFYYGMTCYGLFLLTDRKRYLRTARKCKTSLKQKQCHGNLDVTPYLRIMDIEELSLKESDPYQILDACNRCIEYQEVERFVHLEALANEQANRILRKLHYHDADKFLDQTMKVYKGWGALAIYELLKERRKWATQLLS